MDVRKRATPYIFCRKFGCTIFPGSSGSFKDTSKTSCFSRVRIGIWVICDLPWCCVRDPGESHPARAHRAPGVLGLRGGLKGVGVVQRKGGRGRRQLGKAALVAGSHGGHCQPQDSRTHAWRTWKQRLTFTLFLARQNTVYTRCLPALPKSITSRTGSKV